MKAKNKQPTLRQARGKKPKTFSIITLFPEIVESYANESIIKRAQTKKLLNVKAINPRDFIPRRGSGQATKRQQVDDRPYGGGPGMVLKAEPILKAVEKALGKKRAARSEQRKTGIFMMSPRGAQFDDEMARDMARRYEEIVIVSGRYEGIDARVKKILKAKDVSVGPYVLTGGELPALLILDAVARQIPGVLGDAASLEHTRTAPEDTYTRPDVLVWKKKKHAVPDVLKSGNHRDIENWRSSN